MSFLKVVVALAIRESEHRRPKLTSRERRKINSQTHMYLFIKEDALCYAVLGYARKYVIRNSLKYGRFTTLIIPKCERCSFW